MIINSIGALLDIDTTGTLMNNVSSGTTWTLIGVGFTLIALVLSILGALSLRKLNIVSNEGKKAAEKAKIAAEETKKSSEEAKNASKETIVNTKKIQELSENIAEQTRKPLSSIEEVMEQCFNLAERADITSKITFLGFTLAMGLAHDIKEIRENWTNNICNKKSHFPNKYKLFHEQLGILASNRNSSIICLKTTLIKESFLDKLYKNLPYKKYVKNDSKYIANLEKNINKKHNNIINKHDILHISNIPLQVFIADFKDKDGFRKTGCVVFHVGTENISSGIVRGFYTTQSNLTEMFFDFVKSIELAEKDKVKGRQ